MALLAHATPPAGYALVWSDEFNESSLNTANWEYARNGWRNSAYDTPAAVSVANGSLAITTYTSGGMENIGTALTAGRSFKLFSAGSWSGGFSTVVLSALNSGLAWNTNNLTNGIVSVIAVSPAETLVVSNVTDGGQMQLNWGYGTLQTATNVTGPYSNLSEAVPPFTITTTNAQQFYRIKEN